MFDKIQINEKFFQKEQFHYDGKDRCSECCALFENCGLNTKYDCCCDERGRRFLYREITEEQFKRRGITQNL